MIVSASVASASAPETTPSTARRGGTRTAGATPPSFENSLRDARSQHDRVSERPAGHDESRTRESRPAAGEKGTSRSDDRTRAAAQREGANSEAVDGPTTKPVRDEPADDSAAASSSAPADGDEVGTTPPAQAPAVALATEGLVNGDQVGATTTGTGLAVAGTASTNASVGAAAGVAAEALGATGAAQEAGSLPAPSSTAAQASTVGATATGSPIPALADAVTGAAPTDAASTDATTDTALRQVVPTQAAQPGAVRADAAATNAAQTSAVPAAGSMASGTGTAAGLVPDPTGMVVSVTADGAATAPKATAKPGAESATTQMVAAATTSSTQPVTLAATTASAGPVAPVPTWLQQAVQTQLSGRLVAAARGSEPGAVQRLTLHLHPADLGSVQVVATLDDGTVSLQLAAGNAATREALRAALGTLRSDLAAAGLDGARLDVSDQPPSGHQGLAQQQAGASADGSGRALAGPAREAASSAGQPDRGQATAAVRADVRTGPNGGVDLHL